MIEVPVWLMTAVVLLAVAGWVVAARFFIKWFGLASHVATSLKDIQAYRPPRA